MHSDQRLVGSMCPHPLHTHAQVLAYAGVPDALTSKLRANDWVNAVLGELGGKGGGKPTTAQVRPSKYHSAFFLLGC
jgi:alanyl-tRNA synthetase